MLLCLGEPPVRFLWCCCCSSFYFWSSFCCCIFICRCSLFCRCSFHCFSTSSLTLPWAIAGVSTPHFILSAQPIAEWFATLSFSTIPLSSYRMGYGSEWAFFTHRRFFTLCSFLSFLAQPAFIKASLGAGSYSLKFAGLHTDPQNTDPAHLFVWFTVIHNLHIQNDSVLNSTIYYHELLVVKV